MQMNIALSFNSSKLLSFLYFLFVLVIMLITNRKYVFVLNRSHCHQIILALIHWIHYTLNVLLQMSKTDSQTRFNEPIDKTKIKEKNQHTTSLSFFSTSSEVSFLLSGVFRSNISQQLASNSGHLDSGWVFVPTLSAENETQCENKC